MSALLPDTALSAGLARAASPEEVGFAADRLQRLVDGFAQQLGGQIERKSDSQGTTVRLVLPLREGS